MRRIVKKYFIPYEENEYKPHLLRGRSVLMLSAVVLLLFLWGIFYPALITKTDFFAAIIPSVLVDLANSRRAEAGLPQLAISPALKEAARLKAADMAEKGYFAHTSPEGVTPWHWFSVAGYKFTHAGENLAIRFTDSEAVVEAWMASPSHKANILGSYFTEIGIGVAKGMYNGQETLFVVQMFGRQSSPVPRVAEVPGKKETIPATIIAKEEEPALVAGDETFVVVKSAEEAATPSSLFVPQSSHSALWEVLLVSPGKVIRYLYLSLGALVLLSLILMVFIEIKRQHPRHIFYGASLLILIFAAYYASEILIFRGAVVI